MQTSEPPTSRAQELWRNAEALHAVVYFDKPVRRAIRAAGAPGFWPGYFGTRLAPLRTSDPVVASAVLYVFSTAMVAEHLPSAADGARWNDARLAALADVLPALYADGPPVSHWETAAAQARRLVEQLDPGGRPLYAAHLSQPWPTDPYLAVWHGTTLLREHRGDGHIHELVGASLSGCEAMLVALLWRSHIDDVATVMTRDRGWRPDEVDRAHESLRSRGIVDADGALTARGHELRQSIEEGTDRRALPAGVPDDIVDALIASLRPLRDTAVAQLPLSNPIGLMGGRTDESVAPQQR